MVAGKGRTGCPLVAKWLVPEGSEDQIHPLEVKDNLELAMTSQLALGPVPRVERSSGASHISAALETEVLESCLNTYQKEVAFQVTWVVVGIG